MSVKMPHFPPVGPQPENCLAMGGSTFHIFFLASHKAVWFVVIAPCGRLLTFSCTLWSTSNWSELEKIKKKSGNCAEDRKKAGQHLHLLEKAWKVFPATCPKGFQWTFLKDRALSWVGRVIRNQSRAGATKKTIGTLDPIGLIETVVKVENLGLLRKT